MITPVLPRENNGLIEVDAYKDCPLPEDYEITAVLGDIIMVEYVDVASDGKSLMRNGIILPDQIVDNRSWRVAKVNIIGPEVKQVKVGDIVMFPGDRGLQAIQKNGKMSIFLNENRIFGICKPIIKQNETR